MGIIDTIFGQGLKAVGDFVDKFHMSPEDKAQLQQAMAKMQFDEKQLDYNQQVELAKIKAAAEATAIDSQTKILTTDAQSTDKYISHARPTFSYVIIAAVGYSLLVAPIINAFMHQGLTPMLIPKEYLELFGAWFLGYGAMRSWEKQGDKD